MGSDVNARVKCACAEDHTDLDDMDDSESDSPTVVYSTVGENWKIQSAWDLEARNKKINLHINWLLGEIRTAFEVQCFENPELLDKESEYLRKNFEFLTESETNFELLRGNPRQRYQEREGLRKNTESIFGLLTECVNDHLASDSAREVGKSVLELRNTLIRYLEKSVINVKEREDSEKDGNPTIHEAFETKKAQYEELEEEKMRVLNENENLHKELSDVRSALDEANENLNRTKDTLSSMRIHCKRLDEEVENLEPLKEVNEKLTQETKRLQVEVKALKEEQTLQLEKEKLLTSLKDRLTTRLEEKEITIAESRGQLRALKNELSQEKQRSHCLDNDMITIDHLPDDKKTKVLESRISDQRKKLASCSREEERLRSEIRQHSVNLAMIKSGINQLISDPFTPSSMIHSLKLLRYSSMFSAADVSQGPQAKRVKIEKDIKEEYFEPASPKQQDPLEIEPGESLVSGQEPYIATTDDDTTEESRAEQDRDKGHDEGEEEGTEDNVTSSAGKGKSQRGGRF